MSIHGHSNDGPLPDGQIHGHSTPELSQTQLLLLEIRAQRDSASYDSLPLGGSQMATTPSRLDSPALRRSWLVDDDD